MGDRTVFTMFLLGTLVACSNLNSDDKALAMSKDECRSASYCTLIGTLTRSSDGHAWIGRLTLDSGECVNVSIPDAEMIELGESGVSDAMVAGAVVFYPTSNTDDLVTSFTANGRKVGVGNCGDFFIFVESLY